MRNNGWSESNLQKSKDGMEKNNNSIEIVEEDIDIDKQQSLSSLSPVKYQEPLNLGGK